VPIIGIDHGNGLTCCVDRHTRFINDYLGTLKRILSTLTDEYVWVVSSVCDYSTFDFTWHPSEWQDTMLHVFASDEQKFGDTFYIHVPTFLDKTKNLALLEWFDTIHFVENITVPRRPIPIVHHSCDTHVQAVWEYDFKDPVVQFTINNSFGNAPTINLWRPDVREIVPLSAGASSVLVPRDAKNHLKTQLYDYPVINKLHRNIKKDDLLDIVFISNGEPTAEENWQYLLQNHCNSHINKITRVDGVNGRVASQHAAANAATTPWYFLVPAKLRIAHDFDWSWQPDRLQEPKHYIFHALNPVNGLVYGHMAMVAYNKKLVLETYGKGLDFTLDKPHEVVPIVSGIAQYNESPMMAWRTAFRECIKLKHSLPNVENEYRLNKWLSPSESKFSNYSIWGAQDAVEFYNSVNGNPTELMKSYEWEWLASYAFCKRNLID